MDDDLDHIHVLIAQFADRATPLGTAVDHVPDSTTAARAIAEIAAGAGTSGEHIALHLFDNASEVDEVNDWLKAL